MPKFDFSGWVTRNNLVCSDGRTIRKDAFKHCDGKTVPLVWNHNISTPDNILGTMLLENRDEGVYGYGLFNESESGRTSKELVVHGDIRSLSIYANQVKETPNRDVLKGTIKEVSLVVAGANPGASIEYVMAHGEDSDEISGIILSCDENITIYHSDEGSGSKMKDDETKKSNQNEDEETVGDVLNTLTDKQKKVVYHLIEEALKNGGNDDEDEEDGDEQVKHNIFESDMMADGYVTLTHSDMEDIMKDARRVGSVKEAFFAHAEDYGIDNIDILFPEDRTADGSDYPQFIKRDTGWVSKFMGSVHHTPFSRIKSIFADITEDQARARGYIKGNLKKEEVFSLLKRSTSPTTIYKKQKIDRDDLIDITFDAIPWIKSEMRVMLDEEIARAGLLGDGRLASDDDKIDESRVRPIVNDSDLFTIRWSVATGGTTDATVKNFMYAAIKARKNYKGSGRPVMYTTEDWLTDMLLLEDSQGYKIYKNESELATALRVSEIVTVPPMENFTDKDGKTIYAVIVNPNDYTIGADRGGEVNMFDDFDIDFNQNKYLMETRCSGALTKPFSAIVLRSGTNTESEEPGLAAAKAQL